jgi:hypothetical protein
MFPYVLESDPDRYDSLLCKNRPGGWWETFNLLDGHPRQSIWTAVPMERSPARLRQRRGKPVDFPSLGGVGFGISERALAALRPLLQASIEALPLQCLNDISMQYYVINVLDLVDCLDEERSDMNRFSDGGIMCINRYAFKPGTTDGHHLFKTVQLPLGEPLCSPEFKRLIEESGLVGARFREVGQDPTAS